MMLLSRTAALLDPRANAQSADELDVDRHLDVALIASHSHSIYVSPNSTRRLQGRKRGNDAGRAKANPPPCNAAAMLGGITLHTPLTANLPSFLFVRHIPFL